MHPLECERYMVGFRPLHGYRPTITWLEVDRFFTVCKSQPSHVLLVDRFMLWKPTVAWVEDQPTHRRTDRSATTVTMAPPPEPRPLPCVACSIAVRVPPPPPTAEPEVVDSVRYRPHRTDAVAASRS